MKKFMNKKTGEVAEFVVHKRIEDSEDGNQVYAPFDFNPEEWEDYEEPKEYWYIDCYGEVLRVLYNGNEWDERRKLIGNYFKIKEEAEQAVEKLKAWKWLKDKGFRFTGIEDVERTIHFEIPFRAGYGSCEAEVNLDFLFGGEK